MNIPFFSNAFAACSFEICGCANSVGSVLFCCSVPSCSSASSLVCVAGSIELAVVSARGSVSSPSVCNDVIHYLTPNSECMHILTF